MSLLLDHLVPILGQVNTMIKPSKMIEDDPTHIIVTCRDNLTFKMTIHPQKPSG